MRPGTIAVTASSYFIFVGSMWAGVPAISLLLGRRPPWHDLRVLSLGWVGGLMIAPLVAWVIRHITARSLQEEKKLEIVKSDDYEEMASSYQCLEIARLNEVLKSQGIADVSARQAICETYFFDSGNFLDAGWFKSGDKTLWPELCFAERPLGPEEGLGEVQTLHVVSDSFSFHEYSVGDIYWYFEEHNEDESEIENGCL